MTFKVLEIGSPEWPSRVMGLGPHRRDLHLDQRMLAPYFSAYKHRSVLAVTEGEGGYIVQPLVIKGTELRHAYNFGGPGSPAWVPPNLIKEHIDSVQAWAHQFNVTSEHATLIPWVAQEQLRVLAPATTITTERIKESVYVDVNSIKLRKTTNQLCSKAKAEGVTVNSVPLTPQNMEVFFDMYNKTMDRVGAKEHWRFSYQWFLAFAKYVKPGLLIATFEGKVHSGALIVYSQQYPMAYYHFAATYNKLPTLGINHVLVLAACEFIKSKNMNYLYLGGGITPKTDDNLLIFKAGFSKLRLPVYAYQRDYSGVNAHDTATGTTG